MFLCSMLIRKISRSLCWKMVIAFNDGFLCPAVGEKKRNPAFHTFSRMHNFHSFERLLNKTRLFMAQSATQRSVFVSVDTGPRVAKGDAQSALFDYLHITRGLSFQDADHISKNSPRFLGDLIAKVEREQDVSRALSKFFRYHPINEFEPFFESLGLSPTELASLLPRDLIFLSDDRVLLDSYHVLSNYGVPRSKIGRMYKEVNDIFRYDVGVLDMKLRAYEQLGLGRSTVVKLVSSNPLLLVGEMDKAIIGVLEKLKELGLDSNWIGGLLSTRKAHNWNRILDTLCFLREVGYNDAQMSELCRKDTGLLLEGSGKQVYVVIGSLLKLGLNKKEVYPLVLENPQILSHKCRKNFWKTLHLLIEIGMEPENLARILSSHLKLLGGSHSIRGLKTVLRDFSGDKQSLCQAILNDASTFSKLAFKPKSCSTECVAARNPNNVLEKMQFLLRIGYAENSDEMVKALKMFRGRGDQLQERFDCLVEAGLDYNTVSSMVKQAPAILNQSRDVLEEKIECLKKYTGYPVEAIVGFPTYLCYDMGRIRARFSMYAWLREKGAARPMLSVSTLVACSGARFVKYFVDVHPQGPAMWESIMQMQQQESSPIPIR